MKQFKHVYCNVKGLGSSDYFKIGWINLPLITVELLESTVVHSWVALPHENTSPRIRKKQ